MSIPSEGHRYYTGQYWNDFESVRRHLDRRATGDPDVTWFEDLARQGRRFERALILNCGTGWVERELHRVGIVGEVVGIDIAPHLLDDARRGAVDVGLSATYVEMDVNRRPLPDGPFDLVLNHAAGHHISHINRVFSQVADRLAPDGLFVSWDYVGPHRNQYPAAIWEAAWKVNQSLPDHLRQTMSYPHLDTMLADDPTEAVHSELVLETIERHFEVDRVNRLGGGIGYLLLTHNEAVHAAPLAEVEPWLDHIMTTDAEFTDANPAHTLFAYVIARRLGEARDQADLERWQAVEDERERVAAASGGEYGPRTWLAELTYGSERPEISLGQAISVRWPEATKRYNRLIEWASGVVQRIRSARGQQRTSPKP